MQFETKSTITTKQWTTFSGVGKPKTSPPRQFPCASTKFVEEKPSAWFDNANPSSNLCLNSPSSQRHLLGFSSPGECYPSLNSANGSPSFAIYDGELLSFFYSINFAPVTQKLANCTQKKTNEF